MYVQAIILQRLVRVPWLAAAHAKPSGTRGYPVKGLDHGFARLHSGLEISPQELRCAACQTCPSASCAACRVCLLRQMPCESGWLSRVVFKCSPSPPPSTPPPPPLVPYILLSFLHHACRPRHGDRYFAQPCHARFDRGAGSPGAV